MAQSLLQVGRGAESSPNRRKAVTSHRFALVLCFLSIRERALAAFILVLLFTIYVRSSADFPLPLTCLHYLQFAIHLPFSRIGRRVTIHRFCTRPMFPPHQGGRPNRVRTCNVIYNICLIFRRLPVAFRILAVLHFSLPQQQTG